MPPAGTPSAPPDHAEISSSDRFRPELQALRALAVALVVIYHLAPRQLTGGYVGVDVFFVISGFLMTAHLQREFASTGRIRIGRFYARRVRRLLPAALTVLGATLAGVVAFVPLTLWPELGHQIAASALYVQNWALALNATQYLASASDASPVQHFWSLSVEEQFYLLWPAVIILAGGVAGRLRRSQRSGLIVAVIALAAASFVISVLLTAYEPAAAYFVTPTRIWELAAGGLLHLVSGRMPVPARMRAVASWAGLAIIGSAAATFTATTPFPGATALIPVLGALLVIAAGAPRTRLSPSRLMTARPVQHLGDISYSLYLWHWPLIVLVPFALNGEFKPPLRIGVLVASLVLAEATKRLVEDRFRRGSPRRRGAGAAVVLGAMAAGALAVAIPAASISDFAQSRVIEAGRRFAVEKRSLPLHLGAEAGDRRSTGEVIPPALAAIDDWVATDASGTACQQEGAFEKVTTCEFGDVSGATRVALVGDSHAGQWIPAVARLATRRGWHVTTYLRAGCPLSLVYSTRATDDGGACVRWVGAVLGDLRRARYDVVLVGAFTGLSYASPDGVEGVSKGMAAAWRQVEGAGSRIVALRDPPDPQAAGIADVPTCVFKNAAHPERCGSERTRSVLPDPQVGAVTMVPGARLVDLTGIFCPGACEVVQGGALMYRDGNHLTATYAATLSAALDRAIGGLGGSSAGEERAVPG